MRVWVTRSLPGGERQAQALRAAGHECVVAPVIDIEPVHSAAPEGPFDIVIFVSEHAVRLGLPQLDLTAATLLAVGPRTAEVLQRAVSERPGWMAGPVQTGVRADSEGLLALPVLTTAAGRHVLIVTGAGGRGVLQEQLEARGARVSRFTVYRRVARLSSDVDPTPTARDGTVTVFPPVTIDAISAGSGDGLAAIAELWFGAGGRADVPCLVPSARLVDTAVALGFRSVHDCGGADDAAVLRGLERVRGARDTDRSSERHTR